MKQQLKIKRWMRVVLCLVAVTLLFGASFALAQTDLRGQINDQITHGAGSAGIGRPKDPRVIIAEVIKILLSLIGTIFLALTIFGGYLYLTAKGDETQVEKAKETIKGAITGLIIVMVSYSITIFVGTKFNAATTAGANTTTDTRLP